MGMDKYHPQQTLKKNYQTPPLILEGTGLARVSLNQQLMNKLPEVKCNNIIYNDKTDKFILYPANIASFNMLLNHLSMTELPAAAQRGNGTAGLPRLQYFK